MAALERGTPTPPGALVFLPSDGRAVVPLSYGQLGRLPRAARSALFVDVARGASWVLVPCLKALQAEFNALSPKRDKSSDGTVGDTSHAASSSDHNPDETGATPYEDSDRVNEVHAIDVDNTGPWPSGVTFRATVDRIVANHRAGRDDRLQNVIYMGKICSRSWGWDSWHDYSGANPHDKHAHFSARYLTATEDDVSPWGLTGEDDMDATQMTAWARSADGRAALAQAVLTYDPGKSGDKLVAGGVENIFNTDGTNPTVSPASALRSVLVNERLNREHAARLDTLLKVVALLAERTAGDDQEYADLRDEIDALQVQASNIPRATVDMLGTGDLAESAAQLVAILGPDRAAELAGAITAATGR